MPDADKKLLLKMEEIQDLLVEIRDLLKGGAAAVAGAGAGVATGRSPSEVAAAEKEKKPTGTEDSGRRRCPKCGSLAFTEHTDKDKVLMYQGGQPIYAKKYICNKCGEEVRDK